MTNLKKLFTKICNKTKGFTLVELMIVIAIIGILSAVLVPQASKMRTNAKLAGVDANIRTCVSMVQSVIDDYSSQQNLCAALSSKLTGALTNPINSSTAVLTVTSSNFASASPTHPTMESAVSIIYNISAVTFSSKTGTSATATDYYFAIDGNVPITNSKLIGSVGIVMYGSSTNSLSGVCCYGFDENGKAMSSVSKSSTAYNIEKK